MPDAGNKHSFDALLEPLRKLDAVLSISRKMQIESGEVPPGVLDDFLDLRKQVERAFVMNFQDIDDTLKANLRDFSLHTRDLTTERFARNLEKLSHSVRNMLNALLIQGEPTRSLEDDLADKPAPKPKSQPLPVAKPAPRRRSPALALVLIVLVAGVVLGAAYFGGLLTPRDSGATNTISDGLSNSSLPKTNSPAIDTETFDAAGAGYRTLPGPYRLQSTMNLLDAPPGALPPEDLPAILLGLEELIQVLEPSRLHAPPDTTRDAMHAFAESVIAAEPGWRQARQRFLDAYADHARRRLNLVLYGDKPEVVLVSDVLYAGGGGQQSLCVVLQALALSARCPTGLYAPNGISMPVIGVVTRDGLDTFNGRDPGRRAGVVPAARAAELVVSLCDRLRATCTTPQGRALCVALIARHGESLTADQAHEGLSAIDTSWFSSGQPNPAALLRRQVAFATHAQICAVMLAEGTKATATEALALYRLAAAAGEAETANRALLLLGKRAEKGALVDGVPLALMVGDLLRPQQELQAIDWYRRALEECPDDARPALRLAELLPVERPAMLRQAYARGERSPVFLLDLAGTLAQAGDGLAALAILDDLCAREMRPEHFEKAAITCLSLERPDWAQQRIQAYAGPAAAGLQRLDLICELQQRGLSDRAKSLANAWRESGNKDEFVEGLLKRYGG